MHHEHWMRDTCLTFVQAPWWVTYIISLTCIPFISQLSLTGRYDYLHCTDKETGQQRNPTISHKHWELTFNSCSSLQMPWMMEDRDSLYERGASETWLNKVVSVCGIELNTREQAHVIFWMSQRLGDPLCRFAEGLRWYRYIHVPLKVDQFPVYAHAFCLLL